MTEARLSPTPLSIDAAYAAVRDPACGAVALFVGTIRNHNRGRTVTRLDFDAYGPMAVRELEKILAAAVAGHGLAHALVHHRTGELAIGDIAVIVAVSSAHRAAAFAGCAAIIDELKRTVPIWKKEYLTDGNYWVDARP